jgi:hypothetical protein
MCGGTDLIKEEGIFVCQTCGCKYSVEEAKRMMVEGTVDVRGTVKVDNTAFVEKYLANARRAKQKEDWEETEKYYNMVEQNDPSNIEAIFYSSYGKAKSSLVESDLYKRQAAFKVLTNCVSLIDDNYSIEKEDDEKETIKQISADIFAMACSQYVYNYKKNGHGVVVSSDKLQTVTLFNNLGSAFVTSLEHIIAKYPQGDNRTIFFYEIATQHIDFIIKNGSLAHPSILKEKLTELHTAWNRVDEFHEIPAVPSATNASSGGCYVATAVYGSYDCPQVWTLRRYRDDALAETWYGRAFIRIYYAISPTLVKWFGDTDWFKKMWRGKLDRMVASLNADGVEDTPYEDRKW